MNKKKLVIMLSCIAGGVVILGVVIALLLTPITSFLNGGTSDDFRNVGSCAGRTEPMAEATDGGAFLTPAPIATPKPLQTGDVPDNTEEPATPEPTIDPYQTLYEKADTSMMKDIVNILLVGVDYSAERETWSFKDFHSDVMIVMAVNFDDNRVDLISLPRDTYAEIPKVKGIYKLNAALNCGGNLTKSDGSFNPKSLEKVCEAAEWMLGGISVDYYYAVTMPSLKELVDLCGGLDYDMDIAFKIQGRSYQKGMQHIDGQGFLDYCRVRKTQNGLSSTEAGDDKRVIRQKRMLVALFRQMQADKLITKIPDIVETFDGDLFTNCTTGQTAALAAFAYGLNADNIGMYSMKGSTKSYFQWNFTFTDQKNRVDVIKQVYGKSVKQYPEYTLSYGRYTWCDMLYNHYQELLTPLTDYVQKLIDEDDKLPEFTSSPTPEETPVETPLPSKTPIVTEQPTEPVTPETTIEPTAEPTDTPTPEPTKEATAEPTQESSDTTDEEASAGNSGAVRVRSSLLFAGATPEQIRKYTKEQRELFETYKTCLLELEELHKEADKEAKKAKKGNTNSLNSVGQSYLSKLAEAQTLAIKAATTFGYTKVSNFTVAFSPTDTGWNTKSPWAINYGKDKTFNEVIVDFN